MANLESIVGKLFSGAGSSRSGNLQYPMDVGSMSRSDHYVQFFINEQIDAKASISGGAVPKDTEQDDKEAKGAAEDDKAKDSGEDADDLLDAAEEDDQDKDSDDKD